MFQTWRDLAGLDPAITLHSLRRSYATHHIEEGYESTAISGQLGHEWEASTARYVYLDDDFRQLALLDAQRAPESE